jgi:hypothetical protein
MDSFPSIGFSEWSIVTPDGEEAITIQEPFTIRFARRDSRTPPMLFL